MKGWQYALLNLLGAVCVTVAGLALMTQQETDTLQREVAQRQQLIERGVELSRVNTTLIKALATAALDSGDRDLGSILTDQGISFSLGGQGSGDGQ